jgi:hypothetical protein
MKEFILITLLTAMLVISFSSIGAADQDRQDFTYVVYEGAPYLVIDLAPDKSWAAGEPILIENSHPTTVLKKADIKALPAKHKEWKGRTVTVYRQSKPVCKGNVGEFYLMGRFEPHFGMVQHWFGEPEMDMTPMPKDAVAKAAWDLGAQRGGLRLVAKLKPVEGSKCDTGTWAVVTTRKAPKIFAKKKVPADLKAKVLKDFRSLKGYQANQKEYRESTEEPKPKHWDLYDGAKPTLFFFEDQESGRRFVSVGARAGMGCGSFMGIFWALYEIKGNQLELLTDNENPGAYFIPDLVMDIGNDGKIEFVNDDGIVKRSEAKFKQIEDNAFPSYDCPC